ncbi:AtpZ/AtpI family protein [Bacillus sp. FJAT-27445]|uniref:AtpZ/AtpI family protein n=1 Tax=Bacillus sp. FJAT-27445 TaxID=1679166 RepID=UPI0007445252|nr:AtpZ/AtpI family protein [Bacillus sp. FJAT-27445]
MNKTFSKNFGKVKEHFELRLEKDLLYVHYKNGDFETSANILKNETKSLKECLSEFLKENNASSELNEDVSKFLEETGFLKGNKWTDFTNSPVKALFLYMVFAVAIALSVLLGYMAGDFLDGYFSIYPIFTLLGLAAGLGLGGFAVYSMALKYFRTNQNYKQKKPLGKAAIDWPEIDIGIDEVRKAVRKFSDSLPKGVYRTILVNEDNSVDFSQLTHILGGIPSKKFYMSKETYDLFEESDKDISYEMDRVQIAVDLYVKEKREYPMLPFDPSKRVNYYQLLQNHYLKEQPKIQFYITDYDGLVTHIKPVKKPG